jgi:dipeptidyl aminopeptidase/acylaminoacyl peptidase
MLAKYLRSVLAAISVFVAVPLAAQTPATPSAPPVAKAPPAPLTAADYGRLPFITMPRISPDGTSLSGLISVKGEQVIAILNLFNNADNPVYLKVPEGTQIGYIRWVNKDNILVGAYALLPVEGDRSIVSRLFAVNRVTKKVTRLMWDQMGQGASALWVASDGSPNILMEVQNSIYLGEDFWPAVYRIDVETGKRAQVVKGRTDVMDWYADGTGNVRVGVAYDDSSRKFRLVYRGPEGGLFKTIDTADSRKQEALTRPFLFVPGTSRAMVMRDNELGLTAIYEVDLATQQDVRTVYTAPEGSEVDDVHISADGATLLGVSYSGKTSGIVWFDPSLDSVQKAIDQSVPDKRAWIVSMNADRSRLLIVIDRADSPGALYFFDINGSKMQRVSIFNEKLGTRPLNPVKLVRYKARDGLEIEAVLTLPKDRPAKNLPIVMLPHGGPWGQDTLDYDYWAQFIASRGYVVLQPNFRGSTGYGTEFMRKGEGQLGLAMQDDLTDGLNWAVKEGLADPKRACIVGASYGGYAAMWGIAREPDLYRCAVSIAGVANMRREVNDFGGYLMGGKYKDDWKRMSPDFAAVSPINAIARIKAPLLLIHGKKDITVDYAQSDSMYGKMRAAGKQVELVPLPLADHHFRREEDRVVLLSSIEVFLAKHNPADPAPAK